MQETDAVVLYCTVPDAQTGKMIATDIVQSGLCACVNQIPAITSYYVYDDQFNADSEELLVIKSDCGHLERLQTRIKALHPYAVPEIIATPVVAADEIYLKWMKGALQ